MTQTIEYICCGGVKVIVHLHCEGVDVFVPSVSENIPVAAVDTFNMVHMGNGKDTCKVVLYDVSEKNTDEAIAFCVHDPEGTQIIPTVDTGTLYDDAIMSRYNMRKNQWRIT